MSRPKQNLTPAQRKAYDASMKRLKAQQMKKMLGVGGQKLSQAGIKKLQTSPRKTVGGLGTIGKLGRPVRKQKLTIEQQKKMREQMQSRVSAYNAMTPLQRRRAAADAKKRQRTQLRTLREKPNKTVKEKQFLNAAKRARQQRRAQRIINRKKVAAQKLRNNQLAKKLGVPKAPSRVTRVTRQPPPPREVPKQKTNRRRAVAVSNVVKRKG